MVNQAYQGNGDIMKIEQFEVGSEHEDEVESEADEFSVESFRNPCNDLALRCQIDEAISLNKRLELMNVRVQMDHF